MRRVRKSEPVAEEKPISEISISEPENAAPEVPSVDNNAGSDAPAVAYDEPKKSKKGLKAIIAVVAVVLVAVAGYFIYSMIIVSNPVKLTARVLNKLADDFDGIYDM